MRGGRVPLRLCVCVNACVRPPPAVHACMHLGQDALAVCRCVRVQKALAPAATKAAMHTCQQAHDHCSMMTGVHRKQCCICTLYFTAPSLAEPPVSPMKPVYNPLEAPPKCACPCSLMHQYNIMHYCHTEACIAPTCIALLAHANVCTRSVRVQTCSWFLLTAVHPDAQQPQQ